EFYTHGERPEAEQELADVGVAQSPPASRKVNATVPFFHKYGIAVILSIVATMLLAAGIMLSRRS
ncbi:MAG: hypothetical protein ACF8TS_18275, partial [Maioricimonas sp. JB049]